MPRTTTLFAFCATVAMAVPTGWHILDADIRTDGKRLRPLGQSFTVDDATVSVEVDRGLILTGDSVVVTLVATSEAPKRVTVDLLALQSHNYEGARVESPEIPIDHEKIVLQAAPGGGKPVQTRIKLGDNPNIAARTDNFRIYVRPHGMKLPKHEYSGGLDYSVGLDDGTAAAVSVLGWSSNSLGLTITPEGPIVADQPFVVAVKVKNTSGRRQPHPPSISLGTSINEGGLDTGEDFDITPVEEDDEGAAASEDTSWKRGAVKIQRFTVMPKTSDRKRVTFAASATVWNTDIGPVLAGAMDARTFDLPAAAPAAPTEPNHTVAAK